MEDKKDFFKIINDKGEEVECQVLFTFDSKETNKSYIAYTDNTKDDSGNVQVYASTYDPTGKDTKLYPVETEKEWKIVETILNTIQEEQAKKNKEDEN
ncbi:MAG TPA: DUF1292 domain-containing protein [Bacilli bacterium]|nr:DUF1292 domain-containing protein [Bacilli bacterium]